MADDTKADASDAQKQPAKKKFDDNEGPGNILAGVQNEEPDEDGKAKERRDA